MNDEDIKLTGPVPEPKPAPWSQVKAELRAAGGDGWDDEPLCPKCGCIGEKCDCIVTEELRDLKESVNLYRQALQEERDRLQAITEVLRATEEELAHWQRDAVYWRQQAEWLRRKNLHGCGREYCAVCDNERNS